MKPIQVQPHPDHNRTLVFTNLPQKHPDDPATLKCQISYAAEANNDGALVKAVALDTHVIPAIHDAFKNQTLLWGVLNAVRVTLKFDGPRMTEDLLGALPRIEEVLNITDTTTHDGTV